MTSSSRILALDDNSPHNSGLGSLPSDSKVLKPRRGSRGSTNVNTPNIVMRKDTDCSSDSCVAGLDLMSFIELIPDPSCAIDASGNILYSNLKFRQSIRVQIQHSHRFSILSAVLPHYRDNLCEVVSELTTKPDQEFVQRTCRTYTKDTHENISEETCEWIFSHSSRLNLIYVSVRIRDRTLPRRISASSARVVRSKTEELPFRYALDSAPLHVCSSIIYLMCLQLFRSSWLMNLRVSSRILASA